MGFARSEEVGVSQALAVTPSVPSVGGVGNQQSTIVDPNPATTITNSNSNNVVFMKQISKESTDSSDKYVK